MSKTIVEINRMLNGSTGFMMRNIADCARESGYNVYTSCADGLKQRKIKCKNHIFIGTIVGKRLHNILATRSGNQGGYSKFETKRFLKKLDKLNPDLIHIHNLHTNYLNLEMLFDWIAKKKVPVVLTMHDCWTFTGHCAHFSLVQCDKWKTHCKDCAYYKELYPITKIDKSYEMYELKKSMFEKVSKLHIITPSQWLKTIVEQSFLSSNETTVINNGINLDIFKPAKESKYKERFQGKFVILGVAGLWYRSKGIEYFLELSKMIGNDIQIVLVGQTSGTGYELPDNIVNIPYVDSPQEMAELYSMADVFVNLTLEDTFPTVNIEALACGCPVITFKTGGSPEIIDEKTGIVVEQGDMKGLQNAIECIQTGAIQREDCVNRAQAYDYRDKFKEYVKLYDKILGGTGNSN